MTPVPLVSIGIPTYNRIGTLKRAIDSVLQQDYPNIELIVSDNASSDGSAELCAAYARAVPHMVFIRQPTNRGAGLNFLEVLTNAHGKYFMWLGDDDWLDPSYISECVQVFERRPDCSLVCGQARYFFGDTDLGFGVTVNLLQESPIRRVLTYYTLVRDNGTFYGLMRREEIAPILMPIYVGLANDWLLLAALAFRGKIVTVTGTCVHRLLGSPGGMSCRPEETTQVALARQALEHGLSASDADNPGRAIAKIVFRNIISSSVYAQLSAVTRWYMALRAALTVYKTWSLYDKYSPMSFLLVKFRPRHRMRGAVQKMEGVLKRIVE